jgi:G3E family GTPase
MSGSPLTVSIVAGPSAAALIREIGRINIRIRLGLLTSSSDSENSAGRMNLLVERLPSPGSGQDQNPARIIEQIRAIAERRVVDHLLFECDPDTPVMAFASLFVPQGNSPHPLAEVARLTTAVLALPLSLLLNKLVHRVGTEDPPFPSFLADQLEFTTAIVLEDAASSPDFKLARDVVMTLNPRAMVTELSPNGLEASLLNIDNCFDFASALDSAGWRELIDDQTDRSRDNISAFAYRSRKPFHPKRFWNFIQGRFPGVFRGKGFFWLATRMDHVGGLNLAGADIHYSAAGNWWAARDQRSRELDMPERTRREWREPYGDRRQAIAFMGIDLDPDALRAELDACLLTEAEMAEGPGSWESLIDPFPAWVHHHHTHESGHDCEHDHDHGSDQHDCFPH